MIAFETFKKIAMSFEGVEEHPHFHKQSFRVKKKIFATYDAAKHQATLKLNELDQSVFSAFDSNMIFPVPNKWGKQGWTIVDLAKVRLDLLQDALQTAYFTVKK